MIKKAFNVNDPYSNVDIRFCFYASCFVENTLKVNNFLKDIGHLEEINEYNLAPK